MTAFSQYAVGIVSFEGTGMSRKLQGGLLQLCLTARLEVATQMIQSQQVISNKALGLQKKRCSREGFQVGPE